VARYREKVLPLIPSAVLLAFAFLIAFAPWSLGERELLWSEGYLLTQVLGTVFAPLPLVMAHGEAVPNAHPLFPLLAQFVSALGCPLEISTRLLSLLGTAGLVIVSFVTAFKSRNNVSAGAAAAAVIISSVLIVDKAPDGLHNTLFALILLAGHLLWYYFAALKGDWSRGWLVGLAACAVGFYLKGMAAVVFFIVPLIFMRRPLGIFQRLNNRGIVLGCGILFLTVILWYMPYYFEGVLLASVYPQADWLNGREYLLHLVTFPLDFWLRMLPWALLAWAPFCVEFQTLDPTPIFSRFLRTLFLADFFLLWIMPLDEAHDWIILVPPLAIMSGLNYELAVRRYGNFYRRIGNIAAGVLLTAAGAALLVFYLLPTDVFSMFLELEHPLDFRFEPGRVVLGTASGFMLLTTALILWQMREKPPIWSYWLMIALAPMLLYSNIVQPYQSQDDPRGSRAEILRLALEQDGAAPGVLIYKYGLHDLFTEGVYMKNPVQKITTWSSLPGSEEAVIYVFSASFPNHAERSWRSLLPQPLNTRGGKFNLWRGQWQEAAAPQERKPSPLLQEIMQHPGRELEL